MLSSAWLRWLNKPFARRRSRDAKPPARPRRFFPRLEPLEDRVTPSVDLMVTKTDNTGTGMAVPGKAIIYTITVTNAGPDDLTGATIADTFPATLTGVSFTATQTGGASGFTASGSGNISDTMVNLPNGSSITYVATATISSAATGTLMNTATATPPAGETNTDPNNGTATDTITLTPQADLQVVKSAQATVTAATDFIFTLAVTNNGPSDAQAVSLGDLLPSGETLGGQELANGSAPFNLFNSGNQITDTIPTLTAGASATILVLAEANASAVNTTLMNTAMVSSTTTDPAPGNNSSTASTKVVAPVITITAPLPAGKVGSSYSQTFTTSGGTAPYGFHVTGTLPAGLSFSDPAGSLVLSGIPRSPGTFHFTVTATDANNFSGVQAFTLTVQQGNPAYLFFLTQPGSAAVNGFLPTFQVLALDEFGNRLNGVTVTLALVPVVTIGTGSFVRGSVLQAVAVNGVATFSRVAVSARGRYRLYAFDAPGIFTYSADFDVGLLGRHSPFVA